MTSMFDYDDSINLAFDAKIAGKSLVAAKHELLTKTGDFLFLAHSDRELASRMQMVEEDIEKIAYHKLANISDSKAKLVRTIHEEWSLRHASCPTCGSNQVPNKEPYTHTIPDLINNPNKDRDPYAKPWTNPNLDYPHKDPDYFHTISNPYNPDEDRKKDPNSKGRNASTKTAGFLGGFCHGCGQVLGAAAMGALLASKPSGDHDVFCADCKANPSKINCDHCKTK